MIFIGIGSNLPGGAWDTPLAVCQAALARLPVHHIHVSALSPFYETAPVPASDQPWFINAVAAVTSAHAPAALLAALHELEQEFGRVRRVVNEARILDLDLLDYNGVISSSDPVLPHPRLPGRGFVLRPLRDLAPDWRHPVTGMAIADLVVALPPDQSMRRLAADPASIFAGADLP